MVLKVILLWASFLPVPIINVLLREKFYKPKIGELNSNITGFFVLSVFFLFFVYKYFQEDIISYPNSTLMFMGSAWLILTLAFEFGIGLANKRSWQYMLADYNVFKGRLWPFVLMIIFSSPFIVRSLLK